MLLALDLLSVEELTPVRLVAGNRDMFRVAAAGRGVLVSANLAELQRLREGEMLQLATPGGVINLPIVGIVVDYSDQQGAILIDRTLFLRYWQDDSVNFFRVYLDPGANVAEVKRRILERYAGVRQVFVLNNDELKAFILRITDQWFGLTYIQVAVAVLVAILGIVNTLTVSITDRRRELGVLRAVGGLNTQIRRTIWLEALSTGAIGLILGFASRGRQSLLRSGNRAARRRGYATRLSVPPDRDPGRNARHPPRGIPGGHLAGGGCGTRASRRSPGI